MKEKDYYSAIKGFCLKWNLPEVWNSDRITGANLIYEVIKVINAMIIEQKAMKEMIEEFLLMFNEDLSDTVKDLLTVWLNDGTLGDIINETLFNSKLDKDVFEQNKSEQNLLINNLDTQKLNTSDFNSFKKDIVSKTKLMKIFGEIVLPTNFKKNVSLFRDSLGNINHNYVDLNDYKKVYVKRGVDNGDGSIGSPYSTTINAIIGCEASSDYNHEILYLDDVVYRDIIEIRLSDIMTKSYIINLENKIGGAINKFTYSKSGKLFVTDTSYNIINVHHKMLKGELSLPFKLSKVTTVSQCENRKNSYAVVSGKLYVNIDKEENILPIVSQNVFQVKLDNAMISLKNATILQGSEGAPIYFTSDNLNSNVVVDNVKLYGLGGTDNSNGFSTNNIENVYFMNLVAFNTSRDCFNYHMYEDNLNIGRVFEYNCLGYMAGYNKDDTINNISTAHEGINILRVGLKANMSNGPLIHDIQSCYSVLIDCVANESMVVSGSRKTSYMFEGVGGNVLMINCEGGSESTLGLNSDDIVVELLRCKIYNIKEGTTTIETSV